MTHIAPLVILTSFLVWTAADASVLCVWTKVLPNDDVHYSFLQQGSPSLRLYHSAWSGGRTLLSCAWSDDASVIQKYFSLCQERTQDFTDHPDQNLDLNSVLGAEDQCVSLDSPGVEELGWHEVRRLARSAGGQSSQGQDERSEVRTHLRVKRGFIVPGTLWCGSGNKALSYADLGIFADTDSCCREHDHCKHTILSFHSQFGVFNRNIFTMSHCDCDNTFRSCLRGANDSISDVVGYTFFNLLKMHCFEFSHQLQCTQRNWFGMCKETKMALYAEVYPPTLYESTNPTESDVNSTSSIINTTTHSEIPNSSTTDPQLFSITDAASTVPTPSTSSPSASISPLTNVTTSTVTNKSETPRGSVPESRDDLERTPPILNPAVTDLDADITGLQLSCGIYKDLDECRQKIHPQQMRYGLHNLEPRSLYHCNCTSSCTAVLVRADLPQLDQTSTAEVEEKRHLLAFSLFGSRSTSRSANPSSSTSSSSSPVIPSTATMKRVERPPGCDPPGLSKAEFLEHVRRSNQACQQGDYALAVHLYSEALTADPQNCRTNVRSHDLNRDCVDVMVMFPVEFVLYPKLCQGERSLVCEPIQIHFLLLICISIGYWLSIHRRKRNGERRQPCLTPVSTWIFSCADSWWSRCIAYPGMQKRWTEHFRELLNRQLPDQTVEILKAADMVEVSCEPPTRTEVKKAIRGLCRGKAEGPDEIPAEALQAALETSTTMLHQLIKQIWEEEIIPSDWKDGLIAIVPKKGDLRECNNYRGIMLQSTPGKVFNRIILERLRKGADERLRENQAGFRNGRSSSDQIATLRIIFEQSIEWNASVYVNFIDFEKAFHSIDHVLLWKLMAHYGIPPKYINIMKNTYRKAK
ncbi:hypothetical protein F2P81_002607 [Scophthalmus maximus]|uniref:phospholipase A2 n=1 Tax=Scophthalmus maximus TaxID=52904 RepID=A0A6A4TNW3_SCOMX|nr:hypothetical protein F2P81_002607 [Scophthalmus maximus]